MTRLRKIEEVQSPQVGKFYLVPSICTKVDFKKYETLKQKHYDNNELRYPQLTPDFYAQQPLMFPNQKEFKEQNNFEADHIGKKVLCGNRCPHKGTPLTGAPVNSYGMVVCPTHGLAFKGGKCVKRPSEKEEDDYLQKEYDSMT